MQCSSMLPSPRCSCPPTWNLERIYRNYFGGIPHVSWIAGILFFSCVWPFNCHFAILPRGAIPACLCKLINFSSSQLFSNFDSKRLSLVGETSFSCTVCATVKYFKMRTCFSDLFVSSPKTGWPVVTSICFLATCRDVGPQQGGFSLMNRKPKLVLLTITGVCEHGASGTGSATIRLNRGSSAEAVVDSWFVNNTESRFLHGSVNISTGWEHHGGSLLSAEEMPWVHLFINDVPSRMQRKKNLKQLQIKLV